MRQAIVTKYIGPTNFRGSRVKASAYAGSITIDYDNGKNSEANHLEAARRLALKFGWIGKWVAGGMPTETGNCYVNLDAVFETDSFEIEG